ncbi:MAG: hypothetical protein K2X29_14565, partial [Candidatus Obscuribacterales bacterium]|nr:hypothetical protein [Candidatus Obscuribacterales bacterium]
MSEGLLTADDDSRQCHRQKSVHEDNAINLEHDRKEESGILPAYTPLSTKEIDLEKKAECERLINFANLNNLLNRKTVARSLLQYALMVADEWLWRESDTTLEIL